jgi:AbrB family looped-hinge helix DNA binding protein
MKTVSANTAKVMSKGQITLPVSIRKALRLDAGSTVTLLQQDDAVVMVNSNDYAMRVFQEAMTGEAQRAGLENDADVAEMITAMRRENRS